jgi:hypothetical protein
LADTGGKAKGLGGAASPRKLCSVEKPMAEKLLAEAGCPNEGPSGAEKPKAGAGGLVVAVAVGAE